MLYREIMAVCSEIHTKHINTLCGQNVKLLNVKLVVHIMTTRFYRIEKFLCVYSAVRTATLAIIMVNQSLPNANTQPAVAVPCPMADTVIPLPSVSLHTTRCTKLSLKSIQAWWSISARHLVKLQISTFLRHIYC